eukprot:6190139-Pleurochrysis_carterae.AAC.5
MLHGKHPSLPVRVSSPGEAHLGGGHVLAAIEPQREAHRRDQRGHEDHEEQQQHRQQKERHLKRQQRARHVWRARTPRAHHGVRDNTRAHTRPLNQRDSPGAAHY